MSRPPGEVTSRRKGSRRQGSRQLGDGGHDVHRDIAAAPPVSDERRLVVAHQDKVQLRHYRRELIVDALGR